MQTSQTHNVLLLACRTSSLACFWWWRRPETANLAWQQTFHWLLTATLQFTNEQTFAIIDAVGAYW